MVLELDMAAASPTITEGAGTLKGRLEEAIDVGAELLVHVLEPPV